MTVLRVTFFAITLLAAPVTAQAAPVLMISIDGLRPRDVLEAAGASVETLGAGRAPAPLLQCLHSLAARTELLLNQSKPLAAEVKDFRLGLEIAVIQAFADRIVRLLKARDPLSERVHLNPVELAAFSIGGVTGEMARRAIGLHPQSKPAAGA